MKICFVGSVQSVHIVKWCTWFVNRGHKVHVISFDSGKIDKVHVHFININVNVRGSDINKLKYLFTGKRIKEIIDEIKPDIINAHYATSYGVAMALSGIKDYVLSVWGSDIYDFPRKSILHKALLMFSLKKAKYLFSTSQAMADEAAKYTKKKFEITPFGVDMNLFNPDKRSRELHTPFMIGIVKTLSDLYGIDFILRAVAIIQKENPDIDISVRIAGDESNSEEYKELVKNLKIENVTIFLGRISQEGAAKEWANMDVVVIPSTLYESFGVAAVEVQASGVPVIVSEAEGLLETTNSGKSSEVVPKKDDKAIAETIIKLYRNPELRKQMGIEERKYVSEKYEINRCFEHIENVLFEQIGEVLSKSVFVILSIRQKEQFVVGTVKGLSDKYGIRYILEAVSGIKKQGKIPIKLRIAGKGPQEQEYHKLADKLGISDITTWLGFISQEQAAVEWANMDIAIIPSTLESESFGVSAVEAQACGTPVIISDIPGLKETTYPNSSSLLVKKNNSKQIQTAIEKLYFDYNLKKQMSKNARKFVFTKYNIDYCFEKIESIYKRIIKSKIHK